MSDRDLALAIRILSDAWDVQRRSVFVANQLGEAIGRLPDLSYEGAVATTRQAEELIVRIDALDRDTLPAPVGAAIVQARHAATVRRNAQSWYWTVVDPTGMGFYGLFLTGAYCGGFLLNFLVNALARGRFEVPGDLDRHLGLASDMTQLIDQMTARTVGQAERGMRMPKAQIPAARALIAAFRGHLRDAFAVASSHMAAPMSKRRTGYEAESTRRIAEDLEPAFDRLAAVFDSAYEAEAPDAVGIGQYAGGSEIYGELIRLHTTLPLDAEQVHAEGNRRLAEIEGEMGAIRTQSGHAQDPAGYLAWAGADPRFSASTEATVARVFQRYIDRMAAAFPQAFHAPAKTPYSVAPLPVSLQGSMTFGYYEAPSRERQEGRYLFNPAHLTKTPLLNLASVTFHELVPGHHYHFATQNENEALHPISRHAFCNAFNEGWAEYAATLAGEMGLYQTPEEKYGRLSLDAFLTSRLVVDTGMNKLGWSLERARAFMREHTALSEEEIRSETLRYSCDIPAQALAYKLGDTELLRLRDRVRAIRGARFDLRDFHDAVLEHGAMPLPELVQRIERDARSLE